MVDQSLKLLVAGQNGDGGWGAREGNRSNTEATAFAVLGLTSAESHFSLDAMQKGMHWLISHQNKDGSWPRSAEVPLPSWSTALAVLALSGLKPHRDAALRGAQWLIDTEGSRLPWLASLLVRLSIKKKATQLNDELIGWPWVPGTLSWVEPTSYALIALKRLRLSLKDSRVEERITQGELMIYDRICKGGGWNYGNSSVLGEDLWPYPDITALALIALQDHPRTAANLNSLKALEKMLETVHSGLALSWSILCFSLYDYDAAELKPLLISRFEQTKFLGEIKSIGLSLLALNNGADLLKVA